MRSVHLIVPDLILSEDSPAGVAEGLALPALERMLARGVVAQAAGADSFEAFLCGLFGTKGGEAAISAAYDGLGEGHWLRADPGYMRLQRAALVLEPIVDATPDEAAQLCAALNAHFDGQGMAFLAPHPQRWYMRMDAEPQIRTSPPSQAWGQDVRGLYPEGPGWHQTFNEIQMLLHAHPVNEARDERGGLPINCLWLWGEGESKPVSPYAAVESDEMLARMLARSCAVQEAGWSDGWQPVGEGAKLLVCTALHEALSRGDYAGWRAALQAFEQSHARPLWQALRQGELAELRIDVPGVLSLRLGRGEAWSIWRRPRPLSSAVREGGAV